VSQDELAVINNIKRDTSTLLAGTEIVRAGQQELCTRTGRSALWDIGGRPPSSFCQQNVGAAAAAFWSASHST
jgi:hypothetical protein